MKKPTTRPEREARLTAANELIQVVAAHGRRFFFHEKTGRVARFELDSRNRVWFVDDYSNHRIYTHNPNNWPGFSHGGTLRDLVIAMRQYIQDGKPLHPHCIAPGRVSDPDDSIWGYDRASTIAVRAAAGRLVIIDQNPQISEMIENGS